MYFYDDRKITKNKVLLGKKSFRKKQLKVCLIITNVVFDFSLVFSNIGNGIFASLLTFIFVYIISIFILWLENASFKIDSIGNMHLDNINKMRKEKRNK